MSWEYRIAVKHNVEFNTYEVGIIEVYYGDKTGNILRFWSENFQAPYGGTPKDFKFDLEWMLEGFNKPILNYDIMEAGFPITDFELSTKQLANMFYVSV